MKEYEHKKIDKKWQQIWEKEKVFKADDESDKEKVYVLDMFPYPSADGLHTGHLLSYTGTDIVSRYLRMKGKNVLHPIGWDAFGLPAENFAIKKGVHPRETTWRSIDNFRRQIKSVGFSYDWDREINTADPGYYKWTQWIFLKLYEKGLAYKKKAPVNWCDSCQTVLAREQVIDGRCERCKNQVIQKELEQWFFKITDYADRLIKDLEKVDWPEPIKQMQLNWIGKSEGALIKFPLQGFDFSVEVFTTRPDTLFGATYLVLAPEHVLIEQLKERIENIDEVENYIQKSKEKNELERTDLAKEKTGVEIKGIRAVNPANGEEISVWIADYVLMGYGTGAIMAVPAHDSRDWEFARKYNLPIKEVVKGGDIEKEAYIDKGILVNSGEFSGLDSEQAKEKIISHLKEKGLGEAGVSYRLRDWLISRQRYWGAPIPVIYCPVCGIVPVPEEELPVELPDDVDFKPTGYSPLKDSKSFHKVSCYKCGRDEGVVRESDTMDTFVDSSWYFLRYTDPRNSQEFASKDKISIWCPVDLYVGGAEHAVLHLLYARFFTKVLYDLGYIDFEEPFLKLRNQGMILGEDGQKMSKSRGNVINPDEIIEVYGADTVRVYEMFMGPFEDSKPWSTKGMIGVRRFLDKVWNIAQILKKKTDSNVLPYSLPQEDIPLVRLLHKTVKKVTVDIEEFRFNTAISAMMIFINNLNREVDNIDDVKILVNIFRSFIIILSPFAPHLSEEIWEMFGGEDFVCRQMWPIYREDLTQEDEIEFVVQINGKMRASLRVPTGLSQEEIEEKVMQINNVSKYLDGKQINKKIFVPNRLINFVVK